MKVVIAMDSFKGSMSSLDAGNAAREGVLRAKDAEVTVLPAADGGEGTTEALVEGLGGDYVEIRVTGPMGAPVAARYGIVRGGTTAVIEMAEAAGIMLVKREDLDPWRASTVGVGEMIRDAVRRGCREFILGIGGSATTEGGIGMLQALGYEFYGEDGQILPPQFASLGRIARIEDRHVLPELMECHFQIACDVTNPLCGENGAVYVYGPQKGVKPQERAAMDAQMLHYAKETEKYRRTRADGKYPGTGTENRGAGRGPLASLGGRTPRPIKYASRGTQLGKNDIARMAGAGAAGGLGFALLSFLPDVELRPGIELVLEAVQLERELAEAKIVLTGEGRLDGQTAMGKVPAGVARLAKKHGCRVIAFAGSVTDDAAAYNEAGIDAFFPIVRGVTSLDEAMNRENAERNMTLAVEQVFRLL